MNNPHVTSNFSQSKKSKFYYKGLIVFILFGQDPKLIPLQKNQKINFNQFNKNKLELVQHINRKFIFWFFPTGLVYGHCLAHNPTVVNRSRTVPMLFQLLQWSITYTTLSFIGKAFPLLLTHFRCGTCKNNEVLLTTWFCYWMWDYSLIFFSSSHKPNNKSLHYISRFRMLMALCNSWEALYE